MRYEVAEIKKRVRVVLGEDRSLKNWNALGYIDLTPIDSLTEQNLEAAVREVEQAAPASKLDDLSRLEGAVAWHSGEVGYGSGSIVLPRDFVRLVSFKMSDWGRSVGEAIETTDPRYAALRCRYAGIGGSPQKPAVAIVQEHIGAVLEFYSCSAGAGVYIERGLYLPQRHIEEGYINFSPRLYDAVVYRLGGLVAVTDGRGELAAQLLSHSEQLIKSA